MSTVAKVKDGNVESAIKKVRERKNGYKKPGVRKREKKEEGIKNTRKRERNNR